MHNTHCLKEVINFEYKTMQGSVLSIMRTYSAFSFFSLEHVRITAPHVTPYFGPLDHMGAHKYTRKEMEVALDLEQVDHHNSP